MTFVGATPLFNSVFGQGAGTVVINTIVCNGNETNISNCTLTTPSTCSHYHDASVRCSGMFKIIIVMKSKLVPCRPSLVSYITLL